MTYSECAPTINQPFICQYEGGTVASGNFHKGCPFRELVARDGGGSGLPRIQPAVAVLTALAGIVVHVFHFAFERSVPAEGALVVYTPGEDLVVVRECGDVHATNSKLNDADSVSREVGVEAGPLDIYGILCRSKAELSRTAFSKDVNV